MDTVAVDTAAVVIDSTAVEAPAASNFKLQKKNKTIRYDRMAFLLLKQILLVLIVKIIIRKSKISASEPYLTISSIPFCTISSVLYFLLVAITTSTTTLKKLPQSFFKLHKGTALKKLISHTLHQPHIHP
jgi:hypothetical protein